METNFNTNVGTSLETSHTFDFSDRLYKVVIAFIAVVGLVGAGWVSSQFGALPQNQPHEISISGEGKSFIKPDIAKVAFGVTTQELKSQDAVDSNNQKMNAVIKALKDLGIEDRDIQTTLYNLTPMYDYIERGTVFKGYSLEQQVSVKVRDFTKINSVLDKATSNGATNVGQLQFTVDNPEKAKSEARAMAIEDAREKMRSLARQSGLSIGKLVNISEGYNSYAQPMYGMEAVMKDSVASTPPQIQTGQQEINVNITLTYQIK